jgi:hypothetical protein
MLPLPHRGYEPGREAVPERFDLTLDDKPFDNWFIIPDETTTPLKTEEGS